MRRSLSRYTTRPIPCSLFLRIQVVVGSTPLLADPDRDGVQHNNLQLVHKTTLYSATQRKPRTFMLYSVSALLEPQPGGAVHLAQQSQRLALARPGRRRLSAWSFFRGIVQIELRSQILQACLKLAPICPKCIVVAVTPVVT